MGEGSRRGRVGVGVKGQDTSFSRPTPRVLGGVEQGRGPERVSTRHTGEGRGGPTRRAWTLQCPVSRNRSPRVDGSLRTVPVRVVAPLTSGSPVRVDHLFGPGPSSNGPLLGSADVSVLGTSVDPSYPGAFSSGMWWETSRGSDRPWVSATVGPPGRRRVELQVPRVVGRVSG